jgi:hypothetical protein
MRFAISAEPQVTEYRSQNFVTTTDAERKIIRETKIDASFSQITVFYAMYMVLYFCIKTERLN